MSDTTIMLAPLVFAVIAAAIVLNAGGGVAMAFLTFALMYFMGVASLLSADRAELQDKIRELQRREYDD